MVIGEVSAPSALRHCGVEQARKVSCIKVPLLSSADARIDSMEEVYTDLEWLGQRQQRDVHSHYSISSTHNSIALHYFYCNFCALDLSINFKTPALQPFFSIAKPTFDATSNLHSTWPTHCTISVRFRVGVLSAQIAITWQTYIPTLNTTKLRTGSFTSMAILPTRSMAIASNA